MISNFFLTLVLGLDTLIRVVALQLAKAPEVEGVTHER